MQPFAFRFVLGPEGRLEMWTYALKHPDKWNPSAQILSPMPIPSILPPISPKPLKPSTLGSTLKQPESWSPRSSQKAGYRREGVHEADAKLTEQEALTVWGLGLLRFGVMRSWVAEESRGFKHCDGLGFRGLYRGLGFRVYPKGLCTQGTVYGFCSQKYVGTTLKPKSILLGLPGA